MVLDENLPDVSERAQRVLRDRLPNYCRECGGEVVVAGGQVEAKAGWYDSLDPVLMCENACWKDRFACGVDQQEGQEFRVAPGAEEWPQFDGVTGYCPDCLTDMVKTKDLLLGVDGQRPGRQWKCPECDREVAVREA